MLAASPTVSDASVGFHAQQAVEKCLKAVLALNRVPFGRVHDIQALVDLLAANHLPSPPHSGVLDTLTPYAVLLRYDLAPTTGSLNRRQVDQLVQDVRAWAGNLVR